MITYSICYNKIAQCYNTILYVYNIYIYIYTHTYCIYLYVYIERERIITIITIIIIIIGSPSKVQTFSVGATAWKRRLSFPSWSCFIVAWYVISMYIYIYI